MISDVVNSHDGTVFGWTTLTTPHLEEMKLLTSNRVNNGMDIVIYQDVPMDLCPNFKTHIDTCSFLQLPICPLLNLLYEECRTFRQYSGLS
jgi:hypothetical protein